MAKVLFIKYIEKDFAPAKIFELINKDLGNMLSTGHYLTAFLGIVDPSDNTMTYSKGGHVPPILYRDSTSEVVVLEGSSMFIGHPALKHSATYFEDKIQLKWHDKLILYTDGLTEASNSKDEMYGQERLVQKTIEIGHLSPNIFVKKIVEDSKNFQNGVALDDDLTIICLRIGCDEKILQASGFTVEESPGVLSLSTNDKVESVASLLLKELDKVGLPAKKFLENMHEISSLASLSF